MGGFNEGIGEINPFILPIIRPHLGWKTLNQAQIDYHMEIKDIDLQVNYYENLNIACPEVTQKLFTKVNNLPCPLQRYEVIRRAFEQHLGYEVRIVPLDSLRLFNWQMDRFRVVHDRVRTLEWIYPEGCIPLL